MVQILSVEKTGTVKEVKWNITDIEYNNSDKVLQCLAKKAGFKNTNDFEHACTWELDDISVHLYGKIHGRANYENKYDFPPPVDEILFFGTCILISTENENCETDEPTTSNKFIDLTISKWEKIYEELFGGFEDLVSETSSEDELENIPSSLKTDDGYLKDDFVVNNDVIDYEENGSDESEALLEEEEEELDEDSELSEECFLYSDDEG